MNRDMSSPFDRALESRRRITAAEDFALQHGEPGSREYRAAWLRARQQGDFADAGRRSAGTPSAVDDATAVLKVAVQRAMLVDGAEMGNAQVFDPETESLRIVAHSGLPAEFLDFFGHVDRGAKTSCARALADASAVWVADAASSPLFAGSAGLRILLDAGTRAVASVPVVSPDGDVIAMINTHHRRPATWTQPQQHALERLARTTGQILHALHRWAGPSADNA
jgi:GAF domain-containing protein